jgi:hypothetical protein
MTEHTLAADPTHSRWNRAQPPRLEIDPGETVHCQCVEAAGAQVQPGSLVNLARTTTLVLTSGHNRNLSPASRFPLFH